MTTVQFKLDALLKQRSEFREQLEISVHCHENGLCGSGIYRKSLNSRNIQSRNDKAGNHGGKGCRKSDSNVNADDSFLWKTKSEQKKREGRGRFPSYIDKLKSGEKQLMNMRDAQQFFRLLSKDYGDDKKLVLNFDADIEDVLKVATDLLHPDLSEPLKLLAAMGGEALTQGVYRERMLRCFKTLYGATDFMLTLRQQLKSRWLHGPNNHSTIAWFILQLGKSGDEEVLNDALVWEQIEFFKKSDQAGFPQLSD